ncbi:hypothetical protein XELAEV_18023142mg [Xenopus laevis]|uniref:SCL-interrupting locus protein n=1 Tax=Xenopus laevis TaxID=8355 RepID=A0A974D4J9_XENLA|nr:hypothetical protein XELAEV_18023142mg [Xenopus laevis]
MSTSINLKNTQFYKEVRGVSMENQRNLRSMSNRMLSVNFPPSKCALWDPAPMGDPFGLHFSYYRNPRLLVSEKALRLSSRHAKTGRKPFSCFLLGTFSVDEDEEGVTLTVDRFDPGREKTGSGSSKVPTAQLPGDFIIPCTISIGKGSNNVIVHTPEDLTSSFMSLQSHLHGKEALDLAKLLAMRAHITYTENMDNLHFDLHWAAVTVANTFESTPIKPVPIIPTALARNLGSHNNIAHLQGTHKSGYLTMDQTRKLLLVLESDPKVYMLPLVGIWLSGITHIHSPQVWAACLRYIFSSSIHERVLSESGSFLIILYSLTHKEPEFYECSPCVKHDPLGFQLLTCQDTLHLFKNAEVSKNPLLRFELSSECQELEADLFNETCKNKSTTVFKQSPLPNKLSTSDHDSGVEEEDFSPRPSPRPHPSVQQVSRIHPSVPELSLVFSSFFDPKSASHNPENRTRNNSPFSSTPQNVNNMFAGAPKPNKEPQPCDNQASGLLPRPAPSLNTNSTAMKPSKVKSSPADYQPPHLQSSNQIRRNSTSTSSAFSTPRSGCSPDSTVHQVKGSCEQEQNINGSAQPQGTTPLMRSGSYSRQVSSNFPNHNVTFPLHSRHVAEVAKPSPNLAPFHQTNVCTSCHSPVSCHSKNCWPAMGHLTYHTMENPPETCESVMPAYQNVVCPSVCCPQTAGKTEFCSPVDLVLLSPGRRDSLPLNPCSPHTCRHTPPPVIPTATGMLGLSTEAYRLFAEQDKQLKLLQAQIQRLLEAQAAESEPSKTTIPNNSKQKQVESVSTEQEIKTSVSIAVSTGASLFWNPPCPEKEESMDKQDDSAFCNEFSVNVNTEDTSHATITSSIRAVDIHSFSESTQLTDRGNCTASLHVSHERDDASYPLPDVQQDINNSKSLSNQTDHTESPNTAEIDSGVSAVRPEKFYQDLLTQVNNLLKTSSTEDEMTSTKIDSGHIIEKTESLPCNPTENNDKNVLKATLKQLKSLGVNIDMNTSALQATKADTADSASILACINPEAVIPRLNYMSFSNIGLSGFVPNGVDLSMEANAIALKYLNESQLNQLSLSHANKNKQSDSISYNSLLPGTTEKSMVGLSLISPSNMSFATKKYMKRYGLIESSDSSMEEPDLANASSFALTPMSSDSTSENRLFFNDSCKDGNFVTCEEQKRKNADVDSAIGWAHHPETNKLRNITNEISGKFINVAPLQEDRPLHFLKDLKARTKLSAGKAQFTQHPEKENTGDVQFFHEKHDGFSGKKSLGGTSTVGDILDVNRLRQLPKLF